MNNLSIVITAAGSSTRIGGGIKKEYLKYKTGTVLSTCCLTFLNADYGDNDITAFVVTCPVGGRAECLQALSCDEELQKRARELGVKIKIQEGGETRQLSIFRALYTISKDQKYANIVMIHDGARPFVTTKIIEDTFKAAEKYGAAVPGVTPTDTQKVIDEDGFITEHLVRSHLTAVQTPQAFDYVCLYQAHVNALGRPEKEYTDDTEIWDEYVGRKVKVVPGDVNNIKITYPKDLERL